MKSVQVILFFILSVADYMYIKPCLLGMVVCYQGFLCLLSTQP